MLRSGFCLGDQPGGLPCAAFPRSGGTADPVPTRGYTLPQALGLGGGCRADSP